MEQVLGPRKKIGLIAQDSKKADLIADPCGVSLQAAGRADRLTGRDATTIARRHHPAVVSVSRLASLLRGPWERQAFFLRRPRAPGMGSSPT